MKVEIKGNMQLPLRFNASGLMIGAGSEGKEKRLPS